METAPRHPDLHEFWIGNSELGSMRMSVVEFSTALYQAYHSVLQHQYNISTDKGEPALRSHLTRNPDSSQFLSRLL